MDAPVELRPFTVMVNNHELAVPHCGVSDADILYECLAEGSVTRMIGVFSDIAGVEKIGPVRSIRPYFIDIALSYGAVIGHAGGSEAAYSRIRNEALENIDGVRGSYSFNVFYRDPDRLYRGYEHALFTTGDNLIRCAEEKGYNLTVDESYDTGLHFVKDGTPENGEDADKIELSFIFKKSVFTYDETSDTYSMVEHKQDYIDENTGEKVTFTNLLMLFASTKVLDGYGRLEIGLNNNSGNGFYANGGKYIPITWEKGGNDEVFHYYLEDGSELNIGVGKTYIAVLPIVDGKAEFFAEA